MSVPIKGTCSLILKAILKQREYLQNQQFWLAMQQDNKFNTRKMYFNLKDNQSPVQWRLFIRKNIARPIVVFRLWLAYHDRITTKYRLCRFGMNNEDNCCFYDQTETQCLSYLSVIA